MDINNIIINIVFSSIAIAISVYGKKQQEPKTMIFGGLMFAALYFIENNTYLLVLEITLLTFFLLQKKYNF